jgi:hypothetical protein
MARKTGAFDTFSVMQILVAVFLITLGLIGIIDWNTNLSQFGRSLNRLFGRANDPFNMIVAIVELIAGAIIGVGLFVTLKSRLLFWATIVIAILWAVEIIIGFIAQGAFEPDFVVWLNRLTADLIVLAALWLVNRRYA